MKTHLIAYIESDNKVISVAKVSNVDSETLAKMELSALTYKLEKEKEIKDLAKLLERLETKCKHLEHEINVLKGLDDENQEIVELVEVLEGETNNEEVLEHSED